MRQVYLVAFLAVAGLVALLASTSLGTVRASAERSEAEQSQADTIAVLVDAKSLSVAVRDMQRGQRGFLLTNNPVYLEPYHAGLRDSAALLSRLQAETADDASQQVRLSDLAVGIDALTDTLARTLDLAQGGREAEALALMRTGEGRRNMQGISATLDRIVAEENRLLTLRTEAAMQADARVERLTLQLMLLGAGLLAGGVLLGALAMRRHVLHSEVDTLMRAVLGSVNGAVFVKDKAGRYALMSEVGARIFGRPVADILGRTDADLFLPLSAAIIAAHDAQVLEQGRPLSFDEALETGDRRLLLRTTLTPLHGIGGSIVGLAGVALDVTAQRAAETALAQTEAEARAVFDLAAVGIAQADPVSRRLVRVNRRLAEMTGYAATELLGMTPDQLVQPEDREAAVEGLGRPSGTDGSPSRIEFRLMRRNGTVEWVSISMALSRTPDGTPLRMVMVVEAISQRRRMEQDLARADALLHTIVQSTPGPIFVKDREGRITLANEPTLDVIGKPWADVEGRTDVEFLIDPAQGEAIMASDRRIMDTGVAEVIEEPVSRPDGTPCLWLSTKTPLRDQGGVVTGLVGVSVDITAGHAAKAETQAFDETMALRVREAVDVRETALAQLHEAQKMETIGQMTGGVAHDFNNMLAAILSNLDVARKCVPDARALAQVDAAIKAAERGAMLTKRLLAFARRQDLQTETVDLATLVDGLQELVARSVGPGICIVADLPKDLAPIRVDPGQLELALLNIAVNARDAMPEGGTLTLTGQTVQVDGPILPGGLPVPDGLVPGAYVHLRVTDDGAGMDAATLKRATEPFFTTKGVGKGTGLGLSMVQGLAMQSGGAMRIESMLGQGTTVALWLPQADAEAIPDVAPPMPLPVPETTSTVRRVLVVDDDILVTMGTVAMLEDLGHVVFEANAGQAALDILAQQPEIDLVLTDHAMPGMTGIELARRIRETRPGLPIVLASGYTDLPGGGEGLPRLPKPFRQEELSDLLDRLIASKQMEIQPSSTRVVRPWQ